jgi:hypothetical protein
MSIIIFLSTIIFLAGLIIYSRCAHPKYKDGFSNMNKRCPNTLIQKDSKFFLFNSNLAKIPGVNPIEFNNLEEYTEFLDWQKSQGIKCPVLYLQQTFDAQGNPVFKVRPSVTDLQGGLPPTISINGLTNKQNDEIIQQYDPAFLDDYLHKDSTLLVDATHNDAPYNKNSYPSFDESAYYSGTNTPLDEMDKKKEKPGTVSPDPMDMNWGGAEYTEYLVDKGYYKDNEVSIYVP